MNRPLHNGTSPSERDSLFTRHHTHMSFMLLNSQMAAHHQEIKHLCSAFCPHVSAEIAATALCDHGSVAAPGLYMGEAAYVLELTNSTTTGVAHTQRLSLTRAVIRSTPAGQAIPFINEAILYAVEHWSDRLTWLAECYGLVLSEPSFGAAASEPPTARAIAILSRPYRPELWSPALDPYILNIVSATTIAYLEYAAACSLFEPPAQVTICRNCRDVHAGECHEVRTAPLRVSNFIQAHNSMWRG